MKINMTNPDRFARVIILVITACAISSCNNGSSSPPPIYARLKLEHHSAVSADSTFTIEVSGAFEESTEQAERRLTLAQQLQLWDLDTKLAVPCQATIIGSLYSGEPLRFETATQPLVEGHDYGFRFDSKEVTCRYVGTGGEFERLSEHGELGVFHVGSRLRVWEIGFKGKSIYLGFSEPVAMATLDGAITLTNTKTGRTLATTPSAPAEPSAEATVFVTDAIDVTAEHRLVIARTVTAAAGSPLDGDFSGRPGGADFSLTLSPSQTDLFVNGPSRKTFLQMTCNRNLTWWNADKSAPEPGSDSCRPLE